MKKLVLVFVFINSVLLAQLAPVCFTTAGSFSVGVWPTALTHADFNNDGNQDLAIVNQKSNNVSVLLGTGTGSFASAINFSVGTNPSAIVSNDFNNDGNADLAILNDTSHNVSVLIGDGLAGFAITNYSVFGTSMSSADFNNDGFHDIIVAGSYSAFIFFGSITGTMTSSLISSPIFYTTNSVIAKDVNNDSSVDLIIGNSFPGHIEVALETGAGNYTLVPVSLYPTLPYSPGGKFIVVSIDDFNNDGKQDLITNYNGSNAFYLGAGTGNFSLVSTSNFGPQYLTTNDFNGDGNKDFAYSNYSGVNFKLGLGNGTFSQQGNYPVCNCFFKGICSTDFNNDGLNDIATSNYSANSVVVLINNNTGSYPTINVSTSDTLICIGQSSTLTVSGAVSYSWSTGATTNSIVITPTATSSYTAIATTTNSCKIPATITQNVSSCLNIEESTGIEKNEIIYPNPTNGILNIELLHENVLVYKQVKVEVINILGEMVYTTNINKQLSTIDIKGLPTGIYQLRLIANGKQRVLKFIKD